MNHSPRPTVWMGAALATGTALISGVSVYVSKFGTQAVPDSFVYTTARNLYVGALLLGLLLLTLVTRAPRRVFGPQRRPLTGGDWVRLGMIAIIGGSVPFLLFFYGLTLTTAPMASFLQKTQFLWVAALAIPLLGESFGVWQAAGLLALLGGTILQGPVPLKAMGMGEALVLLSTLLWAGEAVLARRTLRDVPPLVGATARMAGGGVLMLGFLAATGRLGTLAHLTPTQWWWVAAPGLLLLGYVLTWYHALRHAPATVVTSVLTLGAPVTAYLNGVYVTHALPVRPLQGALLLALGSLLLVATIWRPKVRRTMGARRARVVVSA